MDMRVIATNETGNVMFAQRTVHMEVVQAIIRAAMQDGLRIEVVPIREE